MDSIVLKRFQQRSGNSNKPATKSINHYYTYQHLPVEAITGVEPSPCFPNFLARTTFVLESLPEANNPGQDAFLGILSLTVVILDIKAYSLSQIVIIGENKPMHKKSHSLFPVRQALLNYRNSVLDIFPQVYASVCRILSRQTFITHSCVSHFHINLSGKTLTHFC